MGGGGGGELGSLIAPISHKTITLRWVISPQSLELYVPQRIAINGRPIIPIMDLRGDLRGPFYVTPNKWSGDCKSPNFIS